MQLTQVSSPAAAAPHGHGNVKLGEIVRDIVDQRNQA
jgi:hypothetical protein